MLALVFWSTPSVATCLGDTEANSGSLSADIHRILDPPDAARTGGSLAIPADSSLDYYYSKRVVGGAGAPSVDLYGGASTQRLAPADSTYPSKKKPPPAGDIPEPNPALLLVGGALAFLAVRGGRAR